MDAPKAKFNERIKSFYCIMPPTEQTITDFQKRCTLGVAFKSKNDREYFDYPMITVDNGIYLAKVKVLQSDINRIGRVKYFYKKMDIRQAKWWDSETVQKLKRGRQFLDEDYFFDFLQPHAKLFKDQLETVR